MKLKTTGLLVLTCALFSSAAFVTPVQPSEPTMSSPVNAYEVNAADVATIDSIVAAVYNVISGPAGATRDWDRLRGLFRPEVARLSSIGKNKAGEVDVRSFSPNEYIDNASGYFETAAFYESEISRKTEQFGHIAHVFSTYESVSEPGGKPFDRGINSIQLMWDENRWWVMSIYWDRESEDYPIPAKYLE